MEGSNTTKPKLSQVFKQLQTCFKALQSTSKDELTSEQVSEGIQLIVQNVPKDQAIQPIELRVLTQCIK